MMKPTDIVGPLELDRKILVADVVGLDAFNNRERCEVLDEHHRGSWGDGHWVPNAGREHQRTGWRYPYI